MTSDHPITAPRGLRLISLGRSVCFRRYRRESKREGLGRSRTMSFPWSLVEDEGNQVTTRAPLRQLVGKSWSKIMTARFQTIFLPRQRREASDALRSSPFLGATPLQAAKSRQTKMKTFFKNRLTGSILYQLPKMLRSLPLVFALVFRETESSQNKQSQDENFVSKRLRRLLFFTKTETVIPADLPKCTYPNPMLTRHIIPQILLAKPCKEA